MSVRNVLYFETALQSSPELTALARGNRHLPGVSVSHSPPATAPTHPPPSPLEGRSPGGAGCDAPRPRVNGSRAFWKKLVLVLNTFPTVPRPLNQKQLSSPEARAGTLEFGAAVKNERGAFSSLGWRRGQPFPICCNLLTKRTPVSPRKKGPKENPGRPAGVAAAAERGMRAACGQQRGRIGFLGSAAPTSDG